MLGVYFEKNTGNNIITAYRHIDDFEDCCGVSVFNLERLDFVEDVKTDFPDIFHTFCTICDKYN